MKGLLSLLTLVGLLGLSQLAIAEDPVYFADDALKAVVENRLGISDPTPTDMLALTGLDASHRGIVYLTGIEYATNLTDLYLWGNRINNISALSGLNNLTYISLGRNQISDISALSGLMNLSSLLLSYNPLNADAYCIYLPLIEENNPGITLSYDSVLLQDCDEDGIPDACDEDAIDIDGDWVDDGEREGHGCDNCPATPNPDQEDTYPPGGNGIGDACDCECDFNCDGSADADDITTFLTDFARGHFFDLCEKGNPCNGDINCDGNVDALDIPKFLEDLGRNQFNNPCPACEVGAWCSYP